MSACFFHFLHIVCIDINLICSEVSKKNLKSYKQFNFGGIFLAHPVIAKFNNTLKSFFKDHELFRSCQSRLKKNGSSKNQLISITFQIYPAFSCHPSLE